MPTRKEEPLFDFARRNYFCSLFGIIPLVGLLLGPIGFGLGLYTLWTGKAHKDKVCTKLGVLAIAVGLFTSVCNWVGLWLIVRSFSA